MGSISGRRVLVTGGGGFLGREVCASLESRGAAQIHVPRSATCDPRDRNAAEATTLATEHYESPEPVNIGSEQEITIACPVELICELSGFDGEIRWDDSKPDGQPRRCLDVNRARREFGFCASTSFRDGLLETILWYRQQHDRRTQRRVA